MFNCCDMSHILFGMGAISLQDPALVTFTSVGDGAVDESLMILCANVTFLGWHPVWFSMLLLAVPGSELEVRQSWLPSSVFAGNTVVAPRATVSTLTCGV